MPKLQQRDRRGCEDGKWAGMDRRWARVEATLAPRRLVADGLADSRVESDEDGLGVVRTFGASALRAFLAIPDISPEVSLHVPSVARSASASSR